MGARLLILSPTDDRGGAEEYLLTVANRPAIDRDWEATVSFELTPRTRSIAEELKDSTSGVLHRRPRRRRSPMGRHPPGICDCAGTRGASVLAWR